MQLLLKWAIAALLLFPVSTFAHEYWMEAVGSHKPGEAVTVKIFYGEFLSGKTLSGKTLDKMKDIKVYVEVEGKEKQPLTMKQLETHWEGTFTPSEEGNYAISGLNNERDVQDWTKHGLGITRPVQYLKTIYQVGTTATLSQQSMYLDAAVTRVSGDNYGIAIIKNGAAYASAKGIITSFGGKETPLQADKGGKAVFVLGDSGLYLISIEWIDDVPGTFKDKQYETVRHRLDFSVPHKK